MSKLAIVTDSTAYLPPALTSELNMTVVPLVVIWGEQIYKDGIDITPEQFYTRLSTAKVMPSTSQANVPDMQSAFEKLIAEDYEVLGIFLSSALSGTMQSATQALDLMSASARERVKLFDSKTTSMALGFQALAAARAAKDGASVEDCIAIAEKVRANSNVVFAVDTLEFLHRGGRIGGAQRFIGAALDLKPILTVTDGKVSPLERVRTRAKAQDRLLEIVAERCAGKDNVRLAMIHANARADALALLNKASARLSAVEALESEVSPVVGTHVGPGTVGLAYSFGV
jgi:DegV family protein with EDD domain